MGRLRDQTSKRETQSATGRDPWLMATILMSVVTPTTTNLVLLVVLHFGKRDLHLSSSSGQHVGIICDFLTSLVLHIHSFGKAA